MSVCYDLYLMVAQSKLQYFLDINISVFQLLY